MREGRGAIKVVKRCNRSKYEGVMVCKDSDVSLGRGGDGGRHEMTPCGQGPPARCDVSLEMLQQCDFRRAGFARLD